MLQISQRIPSIITFRIDFFGVLTDDFIQHLILLPIQYVIRDNHPFSEQELGGLCEKKGCSCPLKEGLAFPKIFCCGKLELTKLIRQN